VGLPNRESAYVPEPKPNLYLLSETHTTGKSKALLLKNLGYDINNVEQLNQDLLAIANNGDITETVTSEYGTKYIIEGLLQSPKRAKFSTHGRSRLFNVEKFVCGVNCEKSGSSFFV
jgi:hypothetical protein